VEIAVAGVADDPSQSASIAGIWAKAAHDLRQPVQAALLLSKALEDLSDPAELKRTAGYLEGALRSLHDMLEAILLLARVEAGVQTIALRTCDLAEVLQPAMQEAADMAGKRGRRLRLRGVRGTVRSHPSLLGATAKSFVVNAIALGSGEDILLACRRRGKQLRLEVVFKGAESNAIDEKRAFIQLSAPPGDRIGGVVAFGPALLEHVCRLLGKGLEHGKPLPGWRRLGLLFPLAGTGG
jgi:two-component system, sensor histidine kinase